MKTKQKKWFDSAIIKEEASKATANSKHFILNNGTRKAVFSPTNMNYYDKTEGKWKPIDNTLKSTGSDCSAQFGSYTAKLSKNSDNETVEITDGSAAISWEYLGTNKNVFSIRSNAGNSPSAKRKSKLKVKPQLHDALNLTNSSRAIYENAEGNIDIDYLIDGNGIKENITIKDISESYKYYFLFKIFNFRMQKAKNGNDIEFYKSDSPENSSPEFIMPSPFMYDTNGERSDEVHFTFESIGDGNYILSIEADAEWINSAERVFPINIDPQLITPNESYISVSHTKYQWCECCNSFCYDSEWVYAGNPTYDYIYISNGETEKIKSTLKIKKSGIDLTRNTVISAKLVFQKYPLENYSQIAVISIGDTLYYHNNEEQFSVNVTNLYNSSNGDFDVEVEMLTSNASRRFLKAPTLQIEYQPNNIYTVRKSFPIENGVSAELDVLSRNTTVVFDTISDPALGMSVSHVYKPNDEFAEYGKNFRLNLDEKLENQNGSATYIYTDTMGDKHYLAENFYSIDESGKKSYVWVSAEKIETDAEGRLWYNGTEVFREIGNNRGLKATAKLSRTNNSEWVEQRIDEEKQAEEQFKSYKSALCNFVSVTKASGEISDKLDESKLNSPDEFEAFVGCIGCASHLLLPKEEALSYKSMLTQEKSLLVSRESIDAQKKSIKNSAREILDQYNSEDSVNYQITSDNVQLSLLTNELINYSDDSDYSTEQKHLIGETSDTLENSTRRGLVNYHMNMVLSERNKQKASIVKQINKFNFGSLSINENDPSGTLTLQYNSLDEQYNIINQQLIDLRTQLKLYDEKSAKYTDQLKSYYKEYLNLKNRLEVLKAQIPVRYLLSDNGAKGFNEKGELVIVQDKYGSYIAIEREKYTPDGATRISSVYDKDGRSMRFIYNGCGILSQICNSLGEKVSFYYNTSGYLNRLERDNMPILNIEYSVSSGIYRISHISSSDNSSAKITYNLAGMLTGISRTTTVEGISHDRVTLGNTSTLSEMTAKYTDTETKLTYDGIKQEIYKVDQTAQQVNAYYEVINNIVTKAEYYTYENDLLTKTEYPHKSCLNQYSYDTFNANMSVEVVETTTYNSFRLPIAVKTVKYDKCGCATEQTNTEYQYNDEQKLMQIKGTHSYCDCCEEFDTTVAVEKYYYDNAGELVRKESYVKGEKLKTGINIEEHIFDENGNEIKSFTYNSLDPSSKFYTENEIDKNGRVLASFDESGEHKTAFMYGSDGVSVSTECPPNGSKLSYGSTRDGSVTSITHSTENGEENSTTQTRTLDVVTEIKSGNNTVRYEYDGKRRVKSVSLNGVDDYVKYDYSGEHTNAETVTATMADGTEVTSVKDIYENVTSITCNNRSVSNTYSTNHQQLKKTVDSVSGETTFEYDDKGNISDVLAPDHTETYEYDKVENTLDRKTVLGDGISQTYEYGYKLTSNKALDNIRVDGNVVRPHTDALGRNIGKAIEVNNSKIAEEKISYVKFADHATSLPSTVRFAKNGVFNESIQYKYDSMGNIIEVFENGRSACRYEYDSLGRLTREDNVAFGKTTTWAYDNNGNIIAKYEYAITTKPTKELHLLDCTYTPYSYADNSDMLLCCGDENFVYDMIGNPTTYRGKVATWAYGRSLTAYDGNTFSYDARGRRISKNDITFTYDSNGNLIKQSNGLEFFYDHTGVFAVKYNGSTYFYRKDAQANIVALLDNTGAVVVKYKYDAWGNCKVLNADRSEITDSNQIGILNPFRYRSYYFDTETNLYFLKTRYYDPEIGRFMTIDDISYLDPESINGLNLYAYCLNNPVNCIDPTGNAPWWSWLISGVQLVAGIALCFVPGGQGIGVSLIIGGSLGLISNAVSPAISQAIGGASSMANGWGAISTGISLLSFGTPGIIAGIGLMLVGGATMAFGANEIVAAATGTNYIQQWTGMSDSAYGWVGFGLNVASSVGTIAANAYLTYIRISTLRGLESATYGPKASAHVGERPYYDSILLKREIVKHGKIYKATHGVKGFEFRIKGSYVMGNDGIQVITSAGWSSIHHVGNWSLVYGKGVIWHFLLK